MAVSQNDLGNQLISKKVNGTSGNPPTPKLRPAQVKVPKVTNRNKAKRVSLPKGK